MVRRIGEHVTLEFEQVIRAELLVAILSAAHVVEIGAGIEALADSGTDQLERDAAPFTAAAQHQQVSAIGVDVHQLGIERADA